MIALEDLAKIYFGLLWRNLDISIRYGERSGNDMEKSAAGRTIGHLLHACEEIDDLLSKRGLPEIKQLQHWNAVLFEKYRAAADELLKLEFYLRDRLANAN